ncbi:30S ribosomal protein S14 [Streptomyces thinghirensis]|nr:30S ribosomal protein S14 [Streptomyces thinghirensis]
MAKKSKIAKNEQRQEDRRAVRRATVRVEGDRPPAVLHGGRTARRPAGTAPAAPRREPHARAQPRPGRRAPTRLLRVFGLSRVNLRGQAHAGYLPGVRKSSW